MEPIISPGSPENVPIQNNSVNNVTPNPNQPLSAPPVQNNANVMPSNLTNVPTIQQPSPNKKISSHLVMAIISIFFFFPISIFAIINASKSKGLFEAGDLLGAEKCSKKAKVLSIIAYCIGIAFIAGILAIVSFAAKEPLKISNEFLANIDDGKSNEAYALTSDYFKSGVTVNGLTSYVDEYKDLPFKAGKVVSKHVNSDATGTTADFTYVVTDNNKKYNVETGLAKTAEQWKIISLKITPQE